MTAHLTPEDFECCLVSMSEEERIAAIRARDAAQFRAGALAAHSIRACVLGFHRAFDVPVLPEPTVPSVERVRFRLSLIAEEFSELLRAAGVNTFAIEAVDDAIAEALECSGVGEVDLVELADACCDLDYVVEGTRLEFGIDGGPVLDEVHRSNMAKLQDGKVVRREDGKVLKPEGWTKPDIAGVLAQQMRKS